MSATADVEEEGGGSERSLTRCLQQFSSRRRRLRTESCLEAEINGTLLRRQLRESERNLSRIGLVSREQGIGRTKMRQVH